MDPIKRLSLLFRPEDLGLDSADALLRVLKDVFGLAASSGEQSEARVFARARALLLELQIRALMREDDAFSAAGQVSFRKDVATRIRLLRAEIKAAELEAGVTPASSTSASGSYSIDVLSTFGG